MRKTLIGSFAPFVVVAHGRCERPPHGGVLIGRRVHEQFMSYSPKENQNRGMSVHSCTLWRGIQENQNWTRIKTFAGDGYVAYASLLAGQKGG